MSHEHIYPPVPFPGAGADAWGSTRYVQLFRSDGVIESFTTLTDADIRAAALIAGGTPVETIHIPPGDLAESVTLTAPGILIVPALGEGTARIVGDAPTGTRLTIGALAIGVTLRNLRIDLPTDAVGAVVNLAAVCNLENISLLGMGGVGIGIHNNAANAMMHCRNIKYLSGAAACGICQSVATGTLTVAGAQCLGGTLGTFLDISAGDLFGGDINAPPGVGAPTVTDFMKIGAVSACLASILIDSPSVTNGLRFTSDAVDFQVGVAHIAVDVTTHILVDPGLDGLDEGVPAIVKLLSGQVDTLYSINAPAAWLNNAEYISSTLDPEPAERALRALAVEFSVGSPWMGAETSMGEGDSHTQGMLVLRNTNLEAGTWSDITTSVSTVDGVSEDLFSALTVGACVYFGSRWLLPGIKVQITTAGDTLIAYAGAPNVIWETWTGAAWDEMGVMGTDSETLESHGAALSLGVGSEQMRWGLGWESQALKTLNGFADHYWGRIRVISILTTSPAVDQIKIHTSHIQMDRTGLVEMTGTARAFEHIPGWARETLADLLGFSPLNSDIDVSPGITLVGVDNQLAANQIDGRGGSFVVFEWLDSSYDIRLHLELFQAGVGTGDIVLQFHAAKIKYGTDTLDGTATELVISPSPITVPGIVGETFEIETDINLNDLGEILMGDTIFITYRRLGTDGSDNGPAIALAETRIEAVRWRI